MAHRDAMNCAGRGSAAEALAADFLRSRGLTVLTRNYRCRLGEIDIVARDRDAIVFVEVRLRSNATFGGAAASITPAKRLRMARAATHYLAKLRDEPKCRFDAILLDALDPARHRMAQRHRAMSVRAGRHANIATIAHSMVIPRFAT